ncbi:zinc finger CCCH domain-containing protein 4-like [Brassica napus]|uniref:zinc finger CCCH domain-containing protein 4-like n=1 Tax=Brassica napus TaxID=3708 RepID=UPI0006AA98F9|nr:zinc finger CCCH domain-containing protein 4-like [Brassica napus]
MRPIGTSSLPEANEAGKKDPKECNHVHDNKKSHGKGRSRFKGRGRDSYGRQGNHNNRGRGSSCGRGNYGRGRESLKNKNPEAHMVYDTVYDADDDSDLERDDLLDFETSDCLKE